VQPAVVDTHTPSKCCPRSLRQSSRNFRWTGRSRVQSTRRITSTKSLPHTPSQNSEQAWSAWSFALSISLVGHQRIPLLGLCVCVCVDSLTMRPVRVSRLFSPVARFSNISRRQEGRETAAVWSSMRFLKSAFQSHAVTEVEPDPSPSV
jgi:hypothetical protein